VSDLVAGVALAAAVALYYWLARERAAPLTAALAVGCVTLGGPVLWHITAGDGTFASRSLAGAVAAIAWARLTRRLPDAISAIAGATLGLVATQPWIDGGVALAALAPADGLWSSRGGLLATSPALYLGVLGWAPLWRTDRRAALTGLLLLVVVAMFVTAHHEWWTGAWPSASAFAVVTPYLVLGAAGLIDALARLSTRHPLGVSAAALGVLVVWNVTLMGVTRAGGHRIGEPVSFADLGARQARTLHDWIGHPPSYPANLTYATRNDVSPALYDVLSPNAWLTDAERRATADIGGDDGVFVEDGWHARETEGERTFRWATDTATLLVPLARTADIAVIVTLRPFEIPGGVAQTLTLAVNGRAQAPAPLAQGWNTIVVPVPRAHWRTGLNRLSLRFARQARPVDLGAADTRWLAGAVDTVVVEVR
jgi:hypothetical protein